MRVGIFAKTFTGTDPKGVFGKIAAAGFDSTQWNWACAGFPSMPSDIASKDCLNVTKAAKSFGIEITAVSGTFNMAHPEAIVRQTGLAQLKQIIATAPLIGTSLVTLCTGSRNPSDQWARHPKNGSKEAWSDFINTLTPAIESAEENNVFLGIEPELGNVVSTPKHARMLIDDLQSDRLRIVIDPANLVEIASGLERKRVIVEAVELLADRISLAHAKDRKLGGQVAPAGEGIIDFHHYFSTLRTFGYDGEIICHGLHEHEAIGVSRFIKSILHEVTR